MTYANLHFLRLRFINIAKSFSEKVFSERDEGGYLSFKPRLCMPALNIKQILPRVPKKVSKYLKKVRYREV